MNTDKTSTSPSQNSTLIDVGEHRLAIYCMGTGSPTVILDAGMGDAGDIWQQVQHDVAQLTRVCSYDRAGRGQSDPGPLPRTSQTMVAELHTLLTNASISGPYILVGHSFGGYNALLYASQHPDDVVGIILVDSALPDLDMIALLPSESSDEPIGLREGREMLIQEKMQNPEGIDFIISDTQVRSVTSLKDIPLVVLTRASDSWIHMLMKLFPGFPYEVAVTLEQAWQKHQRNLLRLSSQSKQVFAPKSGHYIHTDEPDLVVRAIRDIVEMARQKQSLLP